MDEEYKSMDEYHRTALKFAEEASDVEWMCLARLYLDQFHSELALWMVNQRRCPESVALALYWYSDPAQCLEYRKQGRIPYYYSIRYAVYETAERYAGKGFYRASDLGFDPVNDINDPTGPLGLPRNWLDSLPENTTDEITRMGQPIQGYKLNTLELIEDWCEGLPPHVAEQFFNLPIKEFPHDHSF